MEVQKFREPASDRRVELRVPEGHAVSDRDIDRIQALFAGEVDERPELVKGVVLHQLQGALAIDVFAHGSEAVLHQKAMHWSSLMYQPPGAIPAGHRWSIDSPPNVRPAVIE